MSEAGYVYLLINHAMPGLVKVGLTNRSPAERIKEISSATGVPTPFELVYDVLVPDSLEAERFIHARLTELGYRVTDNREFFRAPIREVVRLMIHLRETMASASLTRISEGQSGVSITEDAPAPPGSDALFRAAAELCIRNKEGSAALLQKELRVGFGRASTILEQLAAAGIIGAQNQWFQWPVVLREDIDVHLARISET